MRKRTTMIAAALAAGAAFTAAIPAQAQPYAYQQNQRDWNHRDRDDYRGNANAIRVQIDQLKQRIQRNDWRDRISEREAAGLRRDVSRLQDQFRDYSRNGLSQSEARTLQQRINYVRSRLGEERRDRDNRRW